MFPRFSASVVIWLLGTYQDGCGAAHVQERQADGCPRGCTDFYAPVCGTDDKTYSSDCWLAISNCENKDSPAVTMRHEGECLQNNKPSEFASLVMKLRTGSNSDSGSKERASDSGSGSEERANDGGIEERGNDGSRGCPRFCPAIYSPLCASNGVTYPNTCTFQSFVCNNNETQLTIVGRGECGKESAGSSGNGASNLPGDVGNPFKTQRPQQQQGEVIFEPSDSPSNASNKGSVPPTVTLVDESRPVLPSASLNADRIAAAGDVKRTSPDSRPPPPYNGDVPTVTITDGFFSGPKK